MLGLYLHIPFCQAICSYCNFNRGLFEAGLKQRYVDALAREIRESGDGRPVDTVFFGGGTPSLLDPDEVGRLLAACREAYDVAADVEITLELNPESGPRDRVEGFLAAGVNRFSVGVQSFDDEELRRLGRVHSAAAARQVLADARAAGVRNLSLDLMCWLPGQSMASWRRTVDRASETGPDHLSVYLLELYPNAPLREAMARAPAGAAGMAWVQSTDDEAAEMYLEGLAALDEARYEQYEISNVARPGFQARHNLKYWRGESWRGFGCGAHSTDRGRRWRNVASTADYVARLDEGRSPAVDVVRLSPAEQVEEALFTGLRLSAGIDRRAFHARHGVDPWPPYAERLKPFVEEGFMWQHDGKFGLTRRGMLVANEILVTFV